MCIKLSVFESMSLTNLSKNAKNCEVICLSTRLARIGHHLACQTRPMGCAMPIIYRLVMISIKWSETAQKNALASTDVIVTQLLCYHMPLLYFVCNHLIYYGVTCVQPNLLQKYWYRCVLNSLYYICYKCITLQFTTMTSSEICMWHNYVHSNVYTFSIYVTVRISLILIIVIHTKTRISMLLLTLK